MFEPTGAGRQQDDDAASVNHPETVCEGENQEHGFAQIGQKGQLSH